MAVFVRLGIGFFFPTRNGWNKATLGGRYHPTLTAENWCVDHITMLTIFVSTKGIKDKTEEELIQWFQDIGYISLRNGNEPAIGVNIFKTKSGDEFYSINITVGIDDEPAQIDGAPVYGWAVLNEYNRRKKQ